jgi:hypothetical protein
MEKYYYQVYLELWRNDELFGMVNISHIPYIKFEELFKDQITKEKFLWEDIAGYWITEELYHKHKEYLDKEMPFKFDFTLFEYSIGLCGDKMEKYKKDYYDELPPMFDSSN